MYRWSVETTVRQKLRICNDACDGRRGIRSRRSETRAGKLSQEDYDNRCIRIQLAGNQIGLTTGLVDEVYHEGYVAKEWKLVRWLRLLQRISGERPEAGDVIILLGKRELVERRNRRATGSSSLIQHGITRVICEARVEGQRS